MSCWRKSKKKRHGQSMATIFTPNPDSFTDNIDNILNNKSNRDEFRNYLNNCNMEDAKMSLSLWEYADYLINSLNAESYIPVQTRNLFLSSIDILISEAEKIQEIDRLIYKELIDARNAGEKTKITIALESLKNALKNAMNREFQTFQRSYISY